MRQLLWYSPKNPPIEIRMGRALPTARYVLDPQPHPANAHLFHQPYAENLSALSLPAFILPLVNRAGHRVPRSTLECLDAYKALDSSVLHIEPLTLILPPGHPPILSASEHEQDIAGLWLQGVDEPVIDALCREAQLLPGLHVTDGGSVRSLGNGLNRSMYLRRLPRIIFEGRDLIADNTDVAVSMGRLFEDMVRGFADPEHAFPHIYLATGYLYHHGLVRVLRVLENPKVENIKLLFSGQTERATAARITALFDSELREGLEHADTDATWQTLYKATQDGRLELRVYTDAFLHAKLFLGWDFFDNNHRLHHARAAIGSSNLSRPGLGAGGNLELDVTIRDQDLQTQLHTWFERRWEEAAEPVPSLLHVLERHRPTPPPAFQTPGLFDVWLAGRDGRLQPSHEHLALLTRLYQDRIARLPDLSDRPFPDIPSRTIEPTGEQASGVLALVQRLEQSRIGFLADSVGLGKTVTALGTAWYLVRNRSMDAVALIAPKKLFHQWRDDARRIGFPWSVIRTVNRHTLERQSPEAAAEMLGDVGLVIVEEAHEVLRNRQNKLWRNLAEYLQSHRACRLLLVSATPWNNRREDIFNYLLLGWQRGRLLQEHFVGLDSAPLRGYLDSLFTVGSSRSASAAARMFERLPIDQYRTLFDHAFVQRTRNALAQRYGAGFMAGGTFPERRVFPHAASSEASHDQLFADLAAALDRLRLPYRDPFRALSLAVQQVAPASAPSASVTDLSESGLQQGSVILLYKRAESSVFALAVSLDNIIKRSHRFQRELEAILAAEAPDRAFEQWLDETYLRLDNPPPEFEDDSEDDSDDPSAREAFLQTLSPAEKARYNNVRSLLARLAEESSGDVLARVIEHVITHDIEPDIAQLTALRDRIDPELDERSPKAIELSRHARRAYDSGHRPLLIASYADTALRFFIRLMTQLPDARIGLALGGDEAWLHEPHTHETNPLTADEWSRAISLSAAERHTALLERANRARRCARADVLDAFAPRARGVSAERQLLLGGPIDILVGSEAISVGQNLQDSTCLIHLDLPWNPMIIEQRIGRIDRRGGGRPDPAAPEGRPVVDVHYCWSIAAIEQEVGLRRRLEQKASRAMEDTHFDELLLFELSDKLREIREARGDAGTWQSEVGRFLDERQRQLVEEQTGVQGIASAGSELDGYRLLSDWCQAHPGICATDQRRSPDRALACTMMPSLSESVPPAWLVTVELTPLTAGGQPIAGNPLYYQLPIADAGGQVNADLEAVVRALHDGGLAAPRPAMHRAVWTEELTRLDRVISAWAEAVRVEHNEDCDARAEQALGSGPRTPSDRTRQALVRARDALRDEIGRIRGLPSEHPLKRAVLAHRDKLRFLMGTALEPGQLPALLAVQDPTEVDSALAHLSALPHDFLQDDFEASFDRLCGALYQQQRTGEPLQQELELAAIDSKWAGVRARVLAATYSADRAR